MTETPVEIPDEKVGQARPARRYKIVITGKVWEFSSEQAHAIAKVIEDLEICDFVNVSTESDFP